MAKIIHYECFARRTMGASALLIMSGAIVLGAVSYKIAKLNTKPNLDLLLIVSAVLHEVFACFAILGAKRQNYFLSFLAAISNTLNSFLSFGLTLYFEILYILWIFLLMDVFLTISTYLYTCILSTKIDESNNNNVSQTIINSDVTSVELSIGTETEPNPANDLPPYEEPPSYDQLSSQNNYNR